MKEYDPFIKENIVKQNWWEGNKNKQVSEDWGIKHIDIIIKTHYVIEHFPDLVQG